MKLKHPKPTTLALFILFFVISCGTLKTGGKATGNIIASIIPTVSIEHPKDNLSHKNQDTTKKRVYDQGKINAIITRLPSAMDRLDRVSEKVDKVSDQFSQYITLQQSKEKIQAVKDSQFNIMFNVANARRRQISAMKADSVEKEGLVLAAIKRMSDAADNDRKYKAKAVIEEKVDTSIILITCIGTIVFGLMSNYDKIVSFLGGLFKKKSYV